MKSYCAQCHTKWKYTQSILFTPVCACARVCVWCVLAGKSKSKSRQSRKGQRRLSEVKHWLIVFQCERNTKFNTNTDLESALEVWPMDSQRVFCWLRRCCICYHRNRGETTTSNEQHRMAVGAHRQSGCNAVIKVSANEARKTRQHQRHGDTKAAGEQLEQKGYLKQQWQDFRGIRTDKNKFRNCYRFCSTHNQEEKGSKSRSRNNTIQLARTTGNFCSSVVNDCSLSSFSSSPSPSTYFTSFYPVFSSGFVNAMRAL